jgi:hypothetical protein
MCKPAWFLASLSDGLFAEPDWMSVGLVLALVGMLLVGNAALLRQPRRLFPELFGDRRLSRAVVRERLFHRVLLSVGFAFVIAGFAVQLLSRTRPPLPEGAPFPVAWALVIAVLAVGLLAVGWWWSTKSIQRTLRVHFRVHPPDFETDPDLARAVGEVFGVASQPEDTIESYVARLRQRIGLAPPDRTRRRRVDTLLEEEVEAD